LKNTEIDLACIGIGENGHIAFNDPGVADFGDPKLVKIAELDATCRKQQVGEGWFSTLDDVPTRALTLTVPAIMRSRIISCVVPDTRKAEAVNNTLYGPVSEDCPASILRTHENVVLWLDNNSASKLSS
jgi:glucosamine-6-phosphate deaminase